VKGGGDGDATVPHSRLVPSSAARRLDRAALLLIGVVTVVAFLPGLFGEFVDWDDDRNFVFNSAYRGLGWPQVRWMFTASPMGRHAPVTWLTLGADYVLWGMRPVGYHVTSLAFHTGAAVVCALVARRLLGAALPATTPATALRIGAAGAALAFAVHPLRVESVVWISARRDVVAGLCYLLAVWTYLRWVDRPIAARRSWYVASLGCFVLAILSKSIAVTLPAVLLVLDVYPLCRLGGASGWTNRAARRVLAEKAPYALLAAVGSVIAVLALARIENMPSWEAFGAGPRLAVAVYGFAFYLGKTLWPVDLSPLYEIPVRIDPTSMRYAVSGMVVVLATAIAVALRRRWPAFAAAWCVYVLSLLPVIGVLQNGPQIAADRYTYIACIGWAMLAGGGLAKLSTAWSSRPRPSIAAALGLVTLIAILLVALTSLQALVWRDSLGLWNHIIATDPHNSRARIGLAVTLTRAGHAGEARRHLEAAVQLNPALPEGHAGLAVTLAVLGDADAAVPHARQAVRQNPRDPALHGVLGDVLRTAGHLDEASTAFRQAARLAPHVAANHYDLAATLGALGKVGEAAAALEDGRRVAHKVMAHDPESDRAEALVYTPSDPERAMAAWERYLWALRGTTEQPQIAIGRIAEGLAALEALRARVRPVGER
jgi:protein O-mannosyl-transferase